jgi:putative oxidoreductase
MKRNKELLSKVVCLALVCLWVYAAVSKLGELEVFRSQMLRQPFPDWLATPLVWGLPALELGMAGLLVFPRTRGWGLWLSLAAMAFFVAYVGLAVSGFYGRVPCACGGVIGRLSWAQHLYFNLFFLLVAGAGVYLQHQKGAGPSQGTADSGVAGFRSGGAYK